MSIREIAIAVSVGVLVFGDALAGSITLGPSKDNTLYESQTGQLSNGVGWHLFAGRTGQGSGSIRRAVLSFDVADSIPALSTIDSVTLKLNMSRTRSGGQPVQLHKLLTSWGEGASDDDRGEGGGDLAEAGDATWLHTFFDTDLWTNPGGDFSSLPSASQTVAGTGFYTWGSTPLMVADVQGWLDDPQIANGWILIGNESVSRTAKRFESRNHPTASLRPQLTIHFTSPTAVETSTWSALKGLFR